MYTYYLHKYAGVDHETGEALYYKNVKDENGNVTGQTTTKNSSESDYYFVWYSFGRRIRWFRNKRFLQGLRLLS